MAEYLFKAQVQNQGLSEAISVSSAGTSGWHDGESMHPKTALVLATQNIEHDDFISSKVKPSDFQTFDYLIAMDDDNLHQLEALFGTHPDAIFKITDLIEDAAIDHIPDPWFTGDFQETESLLTQACKALLARIIQNMPSHEG